jgi:hypothetical protein
VEAPNDFCVIVRRWREAEEGGELPFLGGMRGAGMSRGEAVGWRYGVGSSGGCDNRKGGVGCRGGVCDSRKGGVDEWGGGGGGMSSSSTATSSELLILSGGGGAFLVGTSGR